MSVSIELFLFTPVYSREQIVHFIFCMEGLRGQGTILIHDTEAKKYLEISFSFEFEKNLKTKIRPKTSLSKKMSAIVKSIQLVVL